MGAVQVAERIRSQIERHRFHVLGHDINITVSIGVSRFPEHSKTKKNIHIELADQGDVLGQEPGTQRRLRSDPMKKVKLVVSDFHLGRGKYLSNGHLNQLEDFYYDNKFKEFLDHYSTGDCANDDVELIFNGDMVNMIQTDYHGHYTVVITEGVSTTKLRAIIDRSPRVF